MTPKKVPKVSTAPPASQTVDPLAAVSRRITFLRISFLLCLLAAAAICGGVAYTRIANLEQSAGIQTYESVAASALGNAQALAHQRIEGGKTMVSILKYAFPNASQWPFVALDGYLETANQIAQQSSTLTLALNVIVQPEQAPDFEDWAWKTYRAQGYPETAGFSEDFGFGIYAFGEGGERVHRTTGETTWGSINNIMVPIFQHNNVNATSMLFDVHSKEIQGRVIDKMLECSQQAGLASAKTNPNCGAVTQFTELIIRPGPASLIYQPVYPANDPYTLVGAAGTTVHWEEVLTNIVPSHVNLLAVISSENKSYTYKIQQGKPHLIGEGDLIEDDRLLTFGRSTRLTNSQSDASTATNYHLTVYPANTSFDEYKTNSPLAVSLGFVGVILFCTMVFFLYDFWVQNESHQRKAILQVKRQFVRFISHEIRTPLNTVSMGLELMKTDINRSLHHKNESFDKKAKLSEWVDLTNDVVENSADAILVLNDLLNYDKIEDGTLQLYLGELQMKGFTERVVSQMDMEAKNQKVNLSFAFVDELAKDRYSASGEGSDTKSQCDIETGVAVKEKEHRCVFADENRVRQVVRNLLSNALKFTPENGTVDVTVVYSTEDTCVNKTNTLVEEYAKATHADASHNNCSMAGTCIVRVKDSGVGMTEEQLGRLFGEGVQFDADKLQGGGGSGLGLWISRGIAESHGGSITADSEGHEQGSTFTMTLPLYQVPIDSDPLSGTASTHDLSGNYSAAFNDEVLQEEAPNRKRRILVVDDALLNRKMLMKLLERSGHSCEAACDGDEAVALIAADMAKIKEQDAATDGAYSSHSIDCVLMDYQMPRLNGPDATFQIRELGFQGLVVGVTGNVLPEDIAHFQSMGANSVLAKPVRLSNLEVLWDGWDKKAAKKR